jgi:hypothetical protein
MEESVQNHIARLATLKLKPYKKFIKVLLKIEEQGIVFENDYRKLRSLFQGQIALYLKEECARVITANLTAIGRYVGRGNENSRLREELRIPVFAIINMMMENMGFGSRLDETIIEEMEKAEDTFFPQLLRQAVKEALDNVLVNYSDYCLLNRGEYIQKNDGEYIVFPFLNDHPYGCKIMIGPFTHKADTQIFFWLYVPRYVHEAMANQLYADAEKMEQTRMYEGLNSLMDIMIDHREMPLSVSLPLKDSCLIELEQEDCYNDYIPSFSFNSRDSYAPYRRNYVEIAFALGQRVKYIFLHALVVAGLVPLYTYIAKLEKTVDLYPYYSWELTESGDLVPIEG